MLVQVSLLMKAHDCYKNSFCYVWKHEIRLIELLKVVWDVKHAGEISSIKLLIVKRTRVLIN